MEMNILMLILAVCVGWYLIQLLWYLLVGVLGILAQGVIYIGALIGGAFYLLWQGIVMLFKGIWWLIVIIGIALWWMLSIAISLPVAIVEAVAVGFGVTVKQMFDDIRWSGYYSNRSWRQKLHETAFRNYFFGPGYTTLYNTMDMIVGDLQKELHSITQPRDARDKLEWLTDHVPEFCETLAWTFYMCFGFLSIWIFGIVLGALAVLCWGTGLTVVMLVLCIPVALSWMCDELGLWRRRPRAVCPVCKHRTRMPAFRCACGKIHRRLRPGPYGILRHRCKCGQKLPCTFLNGRAKLQAVCPVCNSLLASSDARPLVFHLAGGTKTGKTTYMTSMFHAMGEQIGDSKRLSFRLAEDPGASFAELMQWYKGAPCPETVRRSGRMYAMLIDGMLVRRQMSVFDISGNVFSGAVSTDELPQLAWSDGLLLVIDPFAGTTLPKPQRTTVSPVSTETVVNHFIRHVTYAGHMKATARCTTPLAVLIAKADEPEVRRQISPAKIAALYDANPGQYAGLDEARDAICRQFLLDIGLNAAVSELEAQFTTVRYFPVSAQGHPSDGMPFEPWGVMPVMHWLISRKDARLAKALQKTKNK